MLIDQAITATFRSASGTLLRQHSLNSFALYPPDELLPVRAPAAYKGQSHLPGLFWMSTLDRLVSYESRLEMMVLKQVDFDPSVSAVLPQPLILHFLADGKEYHHIPDYLVWRVGSAPELINVKPHKYVQKERNQRAFAACRVACSQVGWEYSTQTEPSPVVLANLNWLAGFRRPPPDLPRYGPVLIDSAAHPIRIGEILRDVGVPALVRPVLFHLLWTRQLGFDLGEVLSESSVVARDL